MQFHYINVKYSLHCKNVATCIGPFLLFKPFFYLICFFIQLFCKTIFVCCHFNHFIMVTNRILVGSNTISYIIYNFLILANRKMLFDVQRDEDIIDKLRTQVDVYEDSVYHYHKMIEIAFYKDSVARQLINESNRIKMQVNRKKSK